MNEPEYGIDDTASSGDLDRDAEDDWARGEDA